jgi:hypothetical protein
VRFLAEDIRSLSIKLGQFWEVLSIQSSIVAFYYQTAKRFHFALQQCVHVACIRETLD